MAVDVAGAQVRTTGRSEIVATSTGSRAMWPLMGFAGVILGFVATWAVQFGVSESALEAGGATLLEALNTDSNEMVWRISSGLGYLSVGLLIAFAVGLRSALESRLHGESIVPNVIFSSFLVTCGALIIAWSFRAQVFDGISYYAADTSTHVTINRLSQDTGLSVWAGMLAATAAAAVGTFKYALFPRWFGWLSVLVTVLMTLLVMAGVAFPANIPAAIWLLALCFVSMRFARQQA